MGAIDDFVKMLDRIPLWKRLGELPAEVDDLNRRVADLEAKLGGKWPADVCRKCGERAMRLEAIQGPDSRGAMKEMWACGECQFHEPRIARTGTEG